jgi:hypothetical protein
MTELVGGPLDGTVLDYPMDIDIIEQAFNGGQVPMVPRWRKSAPVRYTQNGRIAYDYMYPQGAGK